MPIGYAVISVCNASIIHTCQTCENLFCGNGESQKSENFCLSFWILEEMFPGKKVCGSSCSWTVMQYAHMERIEYVRFKLRVCAL